MKIYDSLDLFVDGMFLNMIVKTLLLIATFSLIHIMNHL
jgi:hypothetical protein